MYQGDLLKLIFVEVAYTERVHELRVDLLASLILSTKTSLALVKRIVANGVKEVGQVI